MSKSKLNLGCGGNLIKGYLNIGFDDGRLDSESYLNHDLSKNIPVEDNSVDIIYNSHFLEHLNYFEALNFLSNCYNVMKKNGIMRILVPDLELWCLKYLQHDRNFLDTYRNSYLSKEYPTDGLIFMGMLHNHGHKMGWDYQSLKYWLLHFRFRSINQKRYRDSDIDEIDVLEPINDGRELESLCVECYK